MSADVSASSVSHTVIGVDPARALERVLYRCAKQARDRRRLSRWLCRPQRRHRERAGASPAAAATAAYASR